MIRARVVTLRGSFSDEYYALGVIVPGLDKEIVLRCSAFQYPCSEADVDTPLQEGLNSTAREMFQDLVNKLND